MSKGKGRVRVIAGGLKGRLLEYPASRLFRPTMQRAKSSMFETLGARIDGGIFVDLYAAAGAIGIEALSRGARFVCFAERDRQALACLRRNLERCRIAPHRYRIHAGDALELVAGADFEALDPDIVFADPPYECVDFGVLLELLTGIRYAPSVIIVIEHPAEAAMTAPPGWALVRTRFFGRTSVSYFEQR